MNELTKNNSRIEVVDALRGFAIATILILHNLEHFDYLRYPEFLPEWLKVMDNTLMNSLFFLFGGKSYSIFALLFGFTFFIQDSHQAAKGKDFRGRFAWRMLLLLGFSVINSMFFQGDILTLFAVLGLILILFTLTAFASSIHDIAADGFYMLGLDDHTQSLFVGIRNTFFRCVSRDEKVFAECSGRL